MADEQKLCISAGMSFDIPAIDQLEAIKETGFDGFFIDKQRKTDWTYTEPFAQKASKLGLYFQSLHAPFYGMDDIWHDDSGELSDIMIKDLIASIDDCARFDIPIVIMHAIIGMDNFSPNELGLQRLEKVIDYSVKKGVKIAFENTEGEMYLEAILNRYGKLDNIGFCIDTGHEMCYNHSRDIIGKYGDLLISTHLNDNWGITGDEITFLDDCHLLPFDGVGDWENVAKRMKNCGYKGDFTLEVISKGRKGLDTNRKYDGMSLEKYLSEAYDRATRFEELFNTII